MKFTNEEERKASLFNTIKNDLQKNDQIEYFEKIRNDLERIKFDISNLEIQRKELCRKLEEKKAELDIELKIFEVISDKIKKQDLVDNSIRLSYNGMKICEDFSKILIKKYLKQVSDLVCSIFSVMISKKNHLIPIIEIEEDFQLKLSYKELGRKYDANIFSEGEIQLLISSIIWATFKISGRKEMFIFDTPLARLDSINRNSFINYIIKSISDQVIILSTDSEFIGENLNAIKENIYKTYLLDYDLHSKSTRIIESYFWGEMSEY